MQLPRAPEAVRAEAEAEEAKRTQQQQDEYHRDVQAVTELRRHLRKIVANLIAKSKYADFLYPITPDSNPEAYYKVSLACDTCPFAVPRGQFVMPPVMTAHYKVNLT